MMRYLLILFLFLGSCGEDYEAKDADQLPANYFTVRELIIRPYCMSCHPNFESHEVLMGFVKAGSSEDSHLYTIIRSDEMPPTGKKVRKDLKEMLKEWIDGGAGL